MDVALYELTQRLAQTHDNALWVADEHVDVAALAAFSPPPQLSALTNRADVAALLRARSITVALNDFDFASIASPVHIFFRVAKEKALVHHVINRALESLPVGGILWLAGDKHDGIKTYIDKAGERAAGDIQCERNGTVQIAAITRGEQLREVLDDQSYAQARQIDFSPNFSAWSKPGIFGWQKIDAGSAFLCEHLSAVWPHAPQRVLDLGCGYGYLTLQAAMLWPATHFVATDNNIIATQICARNLQEHRIKGIVECCDCADTIRESFDAILCNPPFHQGFAHERALTEKFLRQTQRLLQRNGRALFVVNQFIALEKIAKPLFKRVEVMARNKSFKLVVLEN